MDCILLICFQRLSWQRNNQRGKNMQVGRLCCVDVCCVAAGGVWSPISLWLLPALLCIELLSMCVSVKILDKRHIVKSKKAQYVKRERDLLSNLDHPFFVKLYFTFQDDEKLCILKQRWHAVSCGEWLKNMLFFFKLLRLFMILDLRLYGRDQCININHADDFHACFFLNTFFRFWS